MLLFSGVEFSLAVWPCNGRTPVFQKDALARTDPHLSFNYLHDEIQLSQGHDEKSALR
jgi:hypothetical protein